MVNPALILMVLINLRVLFILPGFLILTIIIFIQNRKSFVVSGGVKNDKKVSLKELLIWIYLIVLLGLFFHNRCWEGVSFTENGGYESLAPIVCLCTCLFCGKINRGWRFCKQDVIKTMPGICAMFLIDLVMRLIGISEISLDSFMGEFKYGGLFQTSNVAGYLACACLIISKQISMKRYVVFWFAITLLTASRTSIAAAFFCVMALDKQGRLRGAKYIIVGGLASGVMVYITNVNWSFESKLLIIERFTEVIESNEVQETILGIKGGRIEVWKKLDVAADGTLLSPHNPFIKMILYYGLLGGMCLVGFLMKSNRSIATMYLLHCASGIVPFFSLMYFDVDIDGVAVKNKN